MDEIKVKIKIPTVINFVFDERGRQYHISELSDEMIESLGRQWTMKLKEHARRNRKTKNG